MAPSSCREAGEQRRPREQGRRGLGRQEEAVGQGWSTGLYDPGVVSFRGCLLRVVSGAEGCCDSSTHYCFAARAVYLETLV